MIPQPDALSAAESQPSEICSIRCQSPTFLAGPQAVVGSVFSDSPELPELHACRRAARQQA